MSFLILLASHIAFFGQQSSRKIGRKLKNIFEKIRNKKIELSLSTLKIRKYFTNLKTCFVKEFSMKISNLIA